MHGSHTTAAAGKAVVGGGAITVGVSHPSDYVSYFDRIYDLGLFMISGDDAARLVAMAVGVLVAINIIVTAIRDYWPRRKTPSKRSSAPAGRRYGSNGDPSPPPNPQRPREPPL